MQSETSTRKRAAMALDRERLLEMQRRMVRIRRFDERASRMVKRGQIPGTVHTSIGQEAQVVGACMALGDEDYMSGNHRSHGHPIGKRSPLGQLMAELVGKATGVCGGYPSRTTIADAVRRVIGDQVPVSVGAPTDGAGEYISHHAPR